METRVDIDFHGTVSIYFSFIWFSSRVEGERTLCFILDILQKRSRQRYICATLKRFKKASNREIPASREEGGFKIETVVLLSVKALYRPTYMRGFEAKHFFNHPIHHAGTV